VALSGSSSTPLPSPQVLSRLARALFTFAEALWALASSYLLPPFEPENVRPGCRWHPLPLSPARLQDFQYPGSPSTALGLH
jgi:hypothetical protein